MSKNEKIWDPKIQIFENAGLIFSFCCTIVASRTSVGNTLPILWQNRGRQKNETKIFCNKRFSSGPPTVTRIKTVKMSLNFDRATIELLSIFCRAGDPGNLGRSGKLVLFFHDWTPAKNARIAMRSQLEPFASVLRPSSCWLCNLCILLKCIENGK